MNVKNIVAAATAVEMALLGISGGIIANAANNSDVTIDGVTYSYYEYKGEKYYSIEKVDENAESINIKSQIDGIDVTEGNFSSILSEHKHENLKKITVDKESKSFISIDGVLYTKSSSSTMDSGYITLIWCPPGYEGELNIPANAGLYMYGQDWFTAWDFVDCKNLTAINVESGNENYYSEDGILYKKRKDEEGETYKWVAAIPRGKQITSYTLPAGVQLDCGFLCSNSYIKELHIYKGYELSDWDLAFTADNLKDIYYDGTKADFLKNNNSSILTGPYYDVGWTHDENFNPIFTFHFSDGTTNEAEQKSVEVSGTDLRISLSQADPNKDNAVDSEDATCILIDYANFMLNGTNKYAINEADANMDGVVDSSDATIILIYYANLLLGNQ